MMDNERLPVRLRQYPAHVPIINIDDANLLLAYYFAAYQEAVETIGNIQKARIMAVKP